MATSGNTSLSMSLIDITLEVYERIGWRPASLTLDQAASARRSFNLVFSRWSNLGVNLWRVSQTPVRQLLRQGVAGYAVDPNVISILPEAVVRQYQMLTAANWTPDFDTTINSTTVVVNQVQHGNGAGNIVQFVVPVAIGGLVIQGFYAVEEVTDANTFTIEAPSIALATDSGGTVPRFETQTGSSLVEVRLVNNGLAAGSPFNIPISTEVGGVTLAGDYTVQSSNVTNAFIFESGQTATSTEEVYENNGMSQIAGQNVAVLPADRVMYPLSRADYSAMPIKDQQGMPSSFWFNRQISPYINVCPLADASMAYEFRYYALRQPEDANIQGWQIPDVPYRGLEALCAAVAAHLAMKWKPDMAAMLKQYADQMWVEFSDSDRERVPFFVTPNLSGYF